MEVQEGAEFVGLEGLGGGRVSGDVVGMKWLGREGREVATSTSPLNRE